MNKKAQLQYMIRKYAANKQAGWFGDRAQGATDWALKTFAGPLASSLERNPEVAEQITGVSQRDLNSFRKVTGGYNRFSENLAALWKALKGLYGNTIGSLGGGTSRGGTV